MAVHGPRRLEGAAAAKLPACPKHLLGEARREWRRLGKRLMECGLFADVDAGALALYCRAWGRWIEAEQQLSKYGTVIKAPSGFLVQSPYLAIANKAMDQMTRILVEFGMSPSSRSRVSASWVPPAQAPRLASPDLQEDPRNLLRVVR
jgi:P27 family predicted phage terminase small subunit